MSTPAENLHINGFASVRADLCHYVVERFRVTARIGILITSDALLFALWVGTAWCNSIIADYFHAHGMHQMFVDGFFWVSSGSTFLLTVVYIGADFVKETRAILSELWHADISHLPKVISASETD